MVFSQILWSQNCLTRFLKDNRAIATIVFQELVSCRMRLRCFFFDCLSYESLKPEILCALRWKSMSGEDFPREQIQEDTGNCLGKERKRNDTIRGFEKDLWLSINLQCSQGLRRLQEWILTAPTPQWIFTPKWMRCSFGPTSLNRVSATICFWNDLEDLDHLHSYNHFALLSETTYLVSSSTAAFPP